MLAKAAFIDRDGVINEERHYVHRIEDFVLLPGCIEGLLLLQAHGYTLVIVTNQAGVAHGLYSEDAIAALHKHLIELLHAQGVFVGGIYYCPHHPLAEVAAYKLLCNCRKPLPGLITKSSMDLGLDVGSSVLIGDKLSDIQAGKAAGVGTNVLVESGHPITCLDRSYADFVAANLYEAASAVCRS